MTTYKIVNGKNIAIDREENPSRNLLEVAKHLSTIGVDEDHAVRFAAMIDYDYYCPYAISVLKDNILRANNFISPLRWEWILVDAREITNRSIDEGDEVFDGIEKIKLIDAILKLK